MKKKKDIEENKDNDKIYDIKGDGKPIPLTRNKIKLQCLQHYFLHIFPDNNSNQLNFDIIQYKPMSKQNKSFVNELIYL